MSTKIVTIQEHAIYRGSFKVVASEARRKPPEDPDKCIEANTKKEIKPDRSVRKS